jgi:hypothetical protein
VRSLDVANDNLQGIDVRNDSLTGPDVLESTLGEVPLAKKADSVGSELLQAGQSVHTEVLQGSGSDLNVRVSRFNMTLVGKN